MAKKKTVAKPVKKAVKKTAKTVLKKVSQRALNRLSNSDLVKHIAKKHNIPENQTKVVIKDIFDFIVKSISKGKTYSQVGFGSFRKTRVKARNGINPMTGDKLRISAHNKVSFSPGETFKRIIK